MNVGKLIDFLETQSEKGISHVYLDQNARDAIRSTIKAQRAQKQAAAPVAVAPAAPVARQPILTPPSQPAPPAQGSPAPAAAPARPQRTAAPVQQTLAPTPPPASLHAVIPPESIPLTLPEGDKMTQIKYLKSQAENWAPASSLGTLRNKMVFSVGTPDSQLMLIGEAPGFEEELKNEPFVGKAGEKLNAILKAMGLNRNALYTTYICKYRPSLPGQTTNNRKPSAEELASCMPLVKKEIEVIKPKCIIALGASAAEVLTGQANAPVGRLRGTWYEFEGIPLRVTYHPSYLLRNEDNIAEKRKLWEDMLAVMEELKLPISDKQRGFFKK